MFKVGLELPKEVAREEPKKGKKKNNESKPNVENLMEELKKAPAEEAPKPVDKEARKAAKYARKQAAKAKKSEEAKKSAGASNSGELSASKPAKAVQAKTGPADQTKTGAQTAVKRAAEPAGGPAAPPKKKLTPLQLKMQQKLSGARFRWINEQLYTTPSQQAFEIFQTQPEVFKEYHDGFRHQVESWPENPVNSFAQQFADRLAKPVNAPGGLPGTKSSGQPAEIAVADMGCGEADLALQLSRLNSRKVHFDVHSFDMNAANERITVADIAHVPLPSDSVNVVVYCLALMGTNLADFINEGIRILKPNGLVWIAEIKSRFEDSDYSSFVESLKDMGLYHKTTDDSNKMFVKFEFVKLPHKLAKAKTSAPDLHLKACIYKRR